MKVILRPPLEPSYSDTAWAWGLFEISKGSINNKIEFLTIKNPTVGKILVREIIP